MALLCLAGGCVDLARPAGLGRARLGHDAGLDAPAGGPGPDASAQGSPDVPGAISDGGVSDSGGADGLPDAEAPPLLAIGRPCGSGEQCASGFCAQGICCNAGCAGVCVACDLPGSEGTCAPVPAGEDNEESCAQEPAATCGLDGTCDGHAACRRYPLGAECVPGGCSGGSETAAATCDGAGACRPGAVTACASGTCSGSSCGAPCGGATACQVGFVCAEGRCTLKRAVASACTSDDQCASGFCSDGVCCGSRCAEICFSCNAAGSTGTCKPAAAGQDPRGQCPAEPVSSCGRAGGCDGSGVCRRHARDVVCVPATCSGGIALAARSCDGLGVCRGVQVSRACQSYVCKAGACANPCADASDCIPGDSCVGTACVPSPGLALFWRFEEVSGTTAADTSGNGRTGIYTGSSGTPAASTDLPPLKHDNAHSRAFTMDSRHAVSVDPMPAALQPSSELTVSVWYRATSVDLSLGGSPTPLGSELVSGGNAYLLRLRALTGGAPVKQVEFSKSIGNGTTFTVYGPTPTMLDGNWHHVAGTTGRTSGMRVYFDGVEVGGAPDQTGDIVYSTSPRGFWVGRHGAGETQWDFGGNLDEVRLYTRALAGAEIVRLAQGFNN